MDGNNMEWGPFMGVPLWDWENMCKSTGVGVESILPSLMVF